jgi:FixJ family two-component response regulator
VVKESRINIVSFSDVASREDKERYWKRMLVVDDDSNITTTFKFGIETANETSSGRIMVDTYSDPRKVLLDFQPNFYDLLLVDINMPVMNGFQLSERILAIDINVKICFMSSGVINCDAMREIHPSTSLGCFIRKPVSMDHLIDRIVKEMD